MILNKKLLLGIVGGIVASFLLVTAGVYHEQVFGAFDFTITGLGAAGGDGTYDNLDVSGTVTTTNLIVSGVASTTNLIVSNTATTTNLVALSTVTTDDLVATGSVSTTAAIVDTSITAAQFLASADGDFSTAIIGWTGGTGLARTIGDLIILSAARGGYNFTFGADNVSYANINPAYDVAVTPISLGTSGSRFADGYIANVVSVTSTIDNLYIGTSGPLVTRMPIKYENYASTTLDFANSVSDGEQDLEITVEGAVDGGICALGLPSALGSRALEWYTCHTSSTADVLVVRRHCRNVMGCGDPGPAGVGAAYIGH